MNITAVNGLNVHLQQVVTSGVTSGVQHVRLALRSLFSASGPLLDQCDLLYYKPIVFVASTPQTLDLKSLPDIFGTAGAVVFARVRFRAIRLDYTGTESDRDAVYLDCGNDGTADEWSLPDGYLSVNGYHRVRAGTLANDGFEVAQAPNTTGWTVSSGGKLWKLTPSAHAFTAHIVLAGSPT